MKKKILILSALFLSLFSFSALDVTAQNQKMSQKGGEISAEKAAKKKSTMLTNTLNLTDSQATEVYDVYLKIAEKNLPAVKEKMTQMKSVTPQSPSNKSAVQKVRKNLFTETDSEAAATDSQMKKILSDSQYVKWVDIKKNPQMYKKAQNGAKAAGKKMIQKKQ